MGSRRRLPVVAIIAAGVALMVGACGVATAGAASPSPSASPTTTAAPAATSAATAASTVSDVDCGPITAANGQNLHVVAKGSAAGVAGCTEAIDVLTGYFQRGNETQGTAHELTVQGWQCSTIDNGVSKEVLTGCEKDGLTIAAVNG